jgi:membrane-associated protease RseP (regulator of RpoE activity)
MNFLMSAMFWMALGKGLAVGVFAVTVSVFVHELGHAVAAWCYGLELEEFRVTPWGGYCTYVDDAHSDDVFNNPVARMVIYAGGAIGNLVTALVTMALLMSGVVGNLPFEFTLFAAFNGMLVLQVVFCTRDQTTDGAVIKDAWEEYRETVSLARA